MATSRKPQDRRSFIRQLASGIAFGFTVPAFTQSKGANLGKMDTRLDAYGGWTAIKGKRTGYFHAEVIDGRHWLITPEGNVFLSFAINHADSSALQYASNKEIWLEKYNGDRDTWIREGVVKDVRNWGFNTIGWTQELVTREWGHSDQWTLRDYQVANLPYCHLLPFSEIQRYKIDLKYPDVFSQEFEDWCDFVARSHCLDMSRDPNLIGYFYGDVPSWIFNTYRESWAEALGVSSDNDWEGLYPIAEKYYQVIHDAIRRYDPNHMLLGERYYGPKPIPESVLKAAAKTVDVVCLELFKHWDGGLEPVVSRMHAITGKPVILADFAYGSPSRLLEVPEGKHFFAKDDEECGRMYRENMTKAFRTNYMVGCHLCVYVENHIRLRGMKDHHDNPYEGYVGNARRFHDEAYRIAAGRL